MFKFLIIKKGIWNKTLIFLQVNKVPNIIIQIKYPQINFSISRNAVKFP